MIALKSEQEFALMRDAGRVVAHVLAWARENVRPGLTTADIDREAERIIRSHGATPEFKGYHGFPASVCASVNDEVVHGLPGARVLEEGDIIGIDVGARLRGFVGDAAVSLPVGQVSEEARRLLETCEECLEKAIAAARPGARISALSAAVQGHAEARGFSLVREYTGHGIGRAMHEEPTIPNYVDWSTRRHDQELLPGMAICIEPMLNLGGPAVDLLDDGWTVATRDGGLSAHFEHTIAIREAATEVMTTL